MTNLYQIALTMINGVGSILARQLLETMGSAEAVFTEKQRLLEKVPGIGTTLAAEIKRPDVLSRAEQELLFAEKNRIRCLFLDDPAYPGRLRECHDAPLVLYYKGAADLNARHIISIVGTRKASSYGRWLTEKLLSDLAVRFPDCLVISGLAYGIDICAHRNALEQHLPTVGVLAHGLDRIYPPVHRNTAVQMLETGGLLTDFPSGTNPDRANFLKRNRIIAGLSEATIVVESAEKGGSLVTADLAISYSRDVYTFPGRITDPYSRGCHELIRRNKAGLIASADDLIQALGWDICYTQQKEARQTCLSFALDERQEQVVQALKVLEDTHINALALHLSWPVQVVSSVLFELELNGWVKALPGNLYQLIR